MPESDRVRRPRNLRNRVACKPKESRDGRAEPKSFRLSMAMITPREMAAHLKAKRGPGQGELGSRVGTTGVVENTLDEHLHPRAGPVSPCCRRCGPEHVEVST